MQNLEKVQEWMQTVLVSRGSLDEKVAYAKHCTGLDAKTLITNTKGVDILERLDIYASGYVLRLLEALYQDFPKLEHFLGKELFDMFAKAYIVSMPSRFWNLHDLAKGFVAFLEQTAPNHEEEQFCFLLNLARLELAYTKSLQAKGLEHKPLQEIHLLDFCQKELSFAVPACVQTEVFDYSMQTLHENIEPMQVIPKKQTSYLALTRKEYRVTLFVLQEWQFICLRCLKKSLSLETLTFVLAQELGQTKQELHPMLLAWLPFAVENNLLELRE